MKFLYIIFFLFTNTLLSSSLQNFSDAFTSIEADELHFLENMIKEKNQSSAYTNTRLVKKEKLDKKGVDILQNPWETMALSSSNSDAKASLPSFERTLVPKQVSMAKKEAITEQKKYLKLKKELAKIQRERQKRKAFLHELKEDIFKKKNKYSKFELKSQAQRKKERQKIEKAVKKKKRLAYISKQKALLKLKKEMQKRKQARLKIQKYKKKLAEKRRKENAQKGYITVKVILSKQRMQVFKNNKLLYKWKVSTARRGHKTPTGNFKAQIVKKMHYSSLYNNSPMPYTIFYDGNYAIHGTSQTRKLGRPASHGCVRLHTKNAKKLYTLVRKNGKHNMSIKIVR
jgi:lipoprotein-anchoring transpeptidase ErfK/SrfK